MAAVAWPAALPDSPLLGHAEDFPDLVQRTEMDAGPAKLRRRFTDTARLVQFPVLLTDAQAAALESFYVTTLAGGALRFSLRHPRTNAVREFRFTAPPSVTLITPGRWRAALALELMP